MKICDLTHAYHATSGGIRTYLDAKRAFLQAHTDHEHVLIVPGEANRTVRDGRLVRHELAAPIIPGSAPYRMFVRLAPIVELLRVERPDVVELGCIYTAPWAAFSYRKRHRGAALVGFCHTDVPGAYVQPAVARLGGPRAGRLAHRAASAYLRAVYRRCDLTLAPSEVLVDTLRAQRVGPVEYLPLGVDTRLFHPEKRDPAVRARFDAGPEERVLVYAGRLDTEKRVNLLLEAFRLLDDPRSRLVLLGEGVLRPMLAEAAAADGRLHLLPYEPDKAALARLLASADAYVTAGPHETFGLSVVEAQASGLPVVGVRAGALVARVPPGTGELAPPDDPAAFAAHLRRLFEDDPRGRGQRARELVERTLSWDATFRKLLELYASLLPERDSRSGPTFPARIARTDRPPHPDSTE